MSVKEKIKRDLENYIFSNPEDTPEFLDIITIALKNYKEKVKEERLIIVDHSLLEMSEFILDSKKLKKMNKFTQVAFLFNTIFLMFPKAITTYHSQGEIDLFNYFCNLVKETKPLEQNLNWIENRIDGEYLVQWFKKLIKENNL